LRAEVERGAANEEADVGSSNRLGPFEVLDGACTLGDRSAGYLLLSEGGVTVMESVSEKGFTPWSRIFELSLHVEPGQLANSGTFSKMTRVILNLGGIPYVSAGPASLAGILRSPYENWAANFDHHPLKYDRREVKLARELVRQLDEAKKISHLGDKRWMAAAIAILRRESEQSVQESVGIAIASMK
jgi:hypothetical protein